MPRPAMRPRNWPTRLPRSTGSIATPPSSHMELALRVCAAGKPALERILAEHGVKDDEKYQGLLKQVKGLR